MKRGYTLELIGIILVYIVTLGFFIISVLAMYYDGVYLEYVMLTTLALFLFSVTVFYHAGLITSWKLMAFIGFITTIFGGLFIYVSNTSRKLNQQEPSYEEKFNTKSKLETKLEEVALLLEKGVITKQEHDQKRQRLIDEY